MQRKLFLDDTGGWLVMEYAGFSGVDDKVSSLFLPNLKKWDESHIRSRFQDVDARAILATPIPQRAVKDRVAWVQTNDGNYSVKSGYHLWHEQEFGLNLNVQSRGWMRIWNLTIPTNMKVFLWRFCRSNIPVKNRLRSKGVALPIISPMCQVDVEHLLHVFFDCNFASQCWQYMGRVYDMQMVEYAPDWLLDKLSTASSEEITKVVKVLWGVWFWRNRRVWEDKHVSPAVAMDWSSKVLADWRKAKSTLQLPSNSSSRDTIQQDTKWTPPVEDFMKLNVDASVFLGAHSFSVGMVVGDHLGNLIAGKNMRLAGPVAIFEAEAVGVAEALSWLRSRHIHKAVVETDSLLTTRAVNGVTRNRLEVGDVIKNCTPVSTTIFK